MNHLADYYEKQNRHLLLCCSLDKVYANKHLYLLIGASCLYFLIKGLRYLFIGSYVPILLAVIILGLLYGSFRTSEKAHLRVIKFWAALITIWAFVRIALYIVLVFNQDLTESHLREQFGLLQNVLSILMLLVGIVIWRKAKGLSSM